MQFDLTTNESSFVFSLHILTWTEKRNETMAEDEKRSDDFFSTLKKTVAENVYFDYDQDEQKKTETIEPTNSTSSTFRVDSSDLITRCRTFLPLLTDANRVLFSQIQSGENVRIELDSETDEDEEEKQRIEMNLMFCRNDDDESSSSSSSDDEILPTTIKTSSEKKIIEIDSTEKDEK